MPFGKLALCQADYMEFMCSVETAEWLMGGGMTHLDGVPVHLQVMDTLRGGANVMVKIWLASDLLDVAHELQAEMWAAA